MASLRDGIAEMPKLVGDFKKTEKEKTIAANFVYCQQMMYKNKNFFPIFAMPKRNGNLACITITDETKVQNTEDLAKFFAAMRYGVTSRAVPIY